MLSTKFYTICVCISVFVSSVASRPSIDQSRNAIKKGDAAAKSASKITDNMTNRNLNGGDMVNTRIRKNNELLKHILPADDEFYDDYDAPIITIRFRRSALMQKMLSSVSRQVRQTENEEDYSDIEDAENDVEISNDTSDDQSGVGSSANDKIENLRDNEKNMLVKHRGNEFNSRDNGTNEVRRHRRRNGKKSNRALRRSLRKSRRRQKNKV